MTDEQFFQPALALSVTPWLLDLAWASDMMLAGFGVATEAFARNGNEGAPERYLTAALALEGGAVVELHLYPETEAVRAVWQCPRCRRVLETEDLSFPTVPLMRVQVQRSVAYWEQTGYLCGPCENGISVEQVRGT